MGRLLSQCFLSLDEMRNCYRLLKENQPRDLAAFAEKAGITQGQAALALTVFSEISLAEVSLRPFSLFLLPMMRRDPRESFLYQAAQRAKEDADGVYGV